MPPHIVSVRRPLRAAARAEAGTSSPSASWSGGCRRRANERESYLRALGQVARSSPRGSHLPLFMGWISWLAFLLLSGLMVPGERAKSGPSPRAQGRVVAGLGGARVGKKYADYHLGLSETTVGIQRGDGAECIVVLRCGLKMITFPLGDFASTQVYHGLGQCQPPIRFLPRLSHAYLRVTVTCVSSRTVGCP